MEYYYKKDKFEILVGKVEAPRKYNAKWEKLGTQIWYFSSEEGKVQTKRKVKEG